MCGITGCIGRSTNPEESLKLLTFLFYEISSLGPQASGFFSVLPNNVNIIHKDSLISYQFLYNNRNIWKKNINSLISICHTRQSTSGSHLLNENNHPHITDNNELAIIHNGIILRHTEDIDLKTTCDSEIILRILEKYSTINEGLVKLFENSTGSITCLSIDQREEIPYLYAFRNQSYFDLFLIDLREQLGQYFFCSRDYLWQNITKKLNKYFDAPLMLIEKNSCYQINPYTLEINKYTVNYKKPQNDYMLNNWKRNNKDYWEKYGQRGEYWFD